MEALARREGHDTRKQETGYGPCNSETKVCAELGFHRKWGGRQKS